MPKAIVSNIADAMMVAGGLLVSYGASIIYQPAGFLTAGVFLIIGGIVVAKGNR